MHALLLMDDIISNTAFVVSYSREQYHTDIFVTSTTFLLKKGYVKSDPKFGRRGCVCYTNARVKKVLECHSGLHTSEKEVPEWRSSTFCHKNTPSVTLEME
jgi:hypothetical protein